MIFLVLTQIPRMQPYEEKKRKRKGGEGRNWKGNLIFNFFRVH